MSSIFSNVSLLFSVNIFYRNWTCIFFLMSFPLFLMNKNRIKPCLGSLRDKLKRFTEGFLIRLRFIIRIN